MPVALCGQVALLVGLVLQLDRLRHDSHHAAAKLDDVDARRCVGLVSSNASC